MNKNPGNKSVLIFVDSDSQIFGALPHAHAFRDKGWQVVFGLGDAGSIPAAALDRLGGAFETFPLEYTEVAGHVLDAGYNVVGVFSKASKIHRVRQQVEQKCNGENVRRPGLFTAFNGFTYERFEEGLAWRVGYDLIALNGPRDVASLQDFLAFGECSKQPYRISGLKPSRLREAGEASRPDKKVFVFAEQVIVPRSRAQRLYLVAELRRLALDNPDWTLKIKCRVKKTERTFHRVSYHFQDLLARLGPTPANLEITYQGMPELLREATLFGTISSTAFFDALHEGVPSIVFSDFGIANALGTHAFAGSGVAVRLKDLGSLSEIVGLMPNAGWLEWVGAANVEAGQVAGYFDGKAFHGHQFEPQYLDARAVEVWEETKKRFVFGAVLSRMIGMFRK
ncbi:DUF6716 putative glycosyltransferase [Sneathiella chinensis]|uniref:Uncharacterized protein n=1 Tax=Sneathiella chinensis TaxID=349750 RepID=A0ABQ5U0R5_9PROT|nr:DUF6716 putative glycosyltransferase [Sneathiella chinensis]GLQ05749.1 hypothetical protein GCM10007924_09700 [Sneathiella chinensis]